MITTEENKRKYNRLGVDLNRLKTYYVNRAKVLLEYSQPYKDEYAQELKKVLISFIDNPKTDLMDMIEGIKAKGVFHNSFGFNNTMFDIEYPDAELIEDVLA